MDRQGAITRGFENLPLLLNVQFLEQREIWLLGFSFVQVRVPHSLKFPRDSQSNPSGFSYPDDLSVGVFLLRPELLALFYLL